MLSSCLGLSEGGRVCVCVEAVFGGKNGSCQQVARATGKLPPPPDPPSLLGRRAAPMFRAEIEGKEKALTQRNATLSDGGCPTITQHIYTAY